jgi:hypothetical protein
MYIDISGRQYFYKQIFALTTSERVTHRVSYFRHYKTDHKAYLSNMRIIHNNISILLFPFIDTFVVVAILLIHSYAHAYG